MHLVVVGGSDAGIAAALRARELDPRADVTVVVADAFPNFSICGIPYHVSGEVGDWRHLAHRTLEDLQDAGLHLRLDTRAISLDVSDRRLRLHDCDGNESALVYDELVIATGAVPVRPPAVGLDHLGEADGVHLLHSMGDCFALIRSIEDRRPKTALIVGAGYLGLEMAECLTKRGIGVTQVERLDQVLPTVDPELGGLVRDHLEDQGVTVHVGTTVEGLGRGSEAGRLHVIGRGAAGRPVHWDVDLVLVVVGVRPNTDLLVGAGAQVANGGAVVVDRAMATGLPHVWAAGDCVVTEHRLLGTTYLPLGTTAHKQGRIAGENALGGHAAFAGSLGTQVVKVFDLVAARTGLREHEAREAGFDPLTTSASPEAHTAYYPGAEPISARVTGDAATGRLLGAQLVGALGTETAKRIDIFSQALFHGMRVDQMTELDLSYTPPFASPWDAAQLAAQAWVREFELDTQRTTFRDEAGDQ